MSHRISAGILVEHDGRLLLVRHHREGRYDFWVAPGGGVQHHEELAQAAQREAREETGLEVVADKLVYVEELRQPDIRHCKFWFTGQLAGGTLDATAPEAVAEYIVEAAWLSRDEMRGLTVFPQVLAERYWTDRAAGFPSIVHLGMRDMAFW